MRRTTFTRLCSPSSPSSRPPSSAPRSRRPQTTVPALRRSSFSASRSSRPGAQFEGTEIGGLSGMAYDADRDVFYALSDDQGQIDPVRFYTLRLDLADGSLDSGDIDFLDVTTLLEPNGQPFAIASADPEGLALTKDDELVVTSEGFAARLIDPFVRLFALDGSSLGALPVPTPFLPAPARAASVRTSASRAPPPRRTAVSSSPGRRARSSRTARRRRSRPAVRRASSATTSRPARSTASTSTGSIRSPSRPCPRRTSPSPGSWSCSR